MKKVQPLSISNVENEFVTLSEAAKIRGVSREAVHALVRRGRLRAVMVFGRLLLFRNEVENFRKNKPGPIASKLKDKRHSAE